MKKLAKLEVDYTLHTLLYKASIYARNIYLARKHRLQIQYYGALLRYSQEEITSHIEKNRRTALNTRRRKQKAKIKYPVVHNVLMNRSANL
ncbi:MAG: hypothetical protein LBR56_04360 [Sporomusaceae bacterium]|nr:hypothetical protein [Sporomusaceae bacterium]